MALTNSLRSTVKSILNKFGETIKIRQRNKTRDTNDDLTYVNTDTQVTAFVEIAGITESIESKGIIRVGDATVYLKHTASINNGDLLKHQGIWYEIKSIAPMYVEGNKVYSECRASPLKKHPAQPD